MESLLRWGIENSSSPSDPDRVPPRPMKDLDPGIIDMILGKPDSALMKEALEVGLDQSKDVETRVTALDNLEMLVEQIDNAKNLTPLKMYPSLLSLLSPSQPDEVRMQTLWILGTAVQNNPVAQADFLQHEPLPLFLSILSHKPSDSELYHVSTGTRSKAAYALSGLLKHNAAAVAELEKINGWNVLNSSLKDADITIRRKIVFMLNVLLLPDEDLATLPASTSAGPNIRLADSSKPTTDEGSSTHPSYDAQSLPTATSAATVSALRKHQVITTLIHSLVSPVPFGPNADQHFDEDYAEKAAVTLATYLEAGGVLTDDEKADLKAFINDRPTKSSIQLDKEVWERIKQSV